MRLPSLFTALLLSAGLWAQLPFSFSGSAGGDCAPQIHNEPWPGGVSPTDLTGSVRFDWSATNATSDPVLMEVRVYRDEYPTTPGNGVQENLEFSFTFTAAPNGTSSGTVFWTCPISSFEELRAHSVRVSGPSGTCTAFSMTVGYVVPAFGNDVEPNSDPSSQPFSTVNIDYDGHLRTNNATDDDWYRIQLPAQGKLLITLQSETPGSTPGTIEGLMTYTTSTLVNTWSGPTGTDNVPNTNVFEQTCAGNANGGIYYLRIRATGACDVSYRMKLTLVAPAFTNDAEPNNSTSSAIILPETHTADGQLYFQHGDNVDIYRANLSSDGVMHIAIEAEQAGTSTTGTLQVILFTSNSTVLETWNVPVGANSIPISTALSKTCRGNTSPYYLQLISSDCGTSYRISYSVTPPLFAQDLEPNNSTPQAIPLPETQTAEGHLNFYFGDNLDIYRLDLTTEGVLHVAFEAEHAGASTAETIQINLSNSVGTILKSWTAPVGANSIAVSSTHDMTCLGTVIPYYLSVASSACGASYRMSYTMTPPLFANDVEPNGSTGQAIVLPPSTPTTGRLNFNVGVNGENSDYYRMNLPTDGVLNVTIEAEHAGLSTIETVAAYISVSTGTTLASWNAAVGASSSPTMTSFSLSCRGTNNPYYLTLISNVCGVSYRVSWTVTAPVYANDPEPNNSTPGTPMNLNAGEQQGHIGFYNLGDADYYAFTHPGGPWSVTVSAEHANAGEGTLNMIVINNPGTLFGTFIVPVGGSSAPLTNTFTIPSLPAGSIYRLVFTEATCGVSYRIHCYDDDNDGTCNAFDLCAGGPEPGTPCDDGNACTSGDVIDANCTCVGTAVNADDGDPCTLDSCDPINGPSHIFQDADNDGTCDANDGCPNDPDKVAPGNCGCGNPEPGATCDDGNALTINDVIDASCNCTGTLLTTDCEGVPGGSATIGTSCDDGDGNTVNDIYDANCNCVGQALDCEGTPGGTATIGTSCDDGNASTVNDVYDASCNCAGTLLPEDCEGTPGGTAIVGTACDDGDTNTVNDLYDANCNCVGQALDCEGTPGGSATIGSPCDDGNASTVNDIYDANCNCAGTLLPVDCEGTPGGTATVGTACDDGNANTGNDLYDANCNCVGQALDCEGTPGGTATVGTACNDGNANTINDAYDANCNCVGTATGSCTGNEVVVMINTDGNADQITWEITNAGNAVIASGGPATGQNNTSVSATACLGSAVTSSCYGFRLMDSFGDGIANGGWELRTTTGKLLLRDAFAGGSVSPATPSANPSYGSSHSFCLPAGSANIATTECGIFDNLLGNKVYCNKVIGASNYQFEFSDPDAGFMRRIARPDNFVHFWDMVTNPLIPGVKYFARVRTDRDGPMVQAHFGSGCEMGLGQVVICTQLIQAPAYGHSCNETRTFNTNNSFIYATPVQGATEYQFRIINSQEGYDQTFIRSSYILQLKWNSNVAPALINGYTYSVEMNVKVNSLYSGFCASTCNITIDNSGGLAMSMTQANGTATMWPNPVRDGQVNLNIDGLEDPEQTITVDIQDIYGKLVFAKEFENSGERFNAILNLSGEIASGVYMVNITVNGERTVQRLSIMK